MLFWTETAFPFSILGRVLLLHEPSWDDDGAVFCLPHRWNFVLHFWWAFSPSGGRKSRHPLPKKLCLDNALVKGQCWLICSLENGYFHGGSGHRYPFNSREDMRQKKCPNLIVLKWFNSSGKKLEYLNICCISLSFPSSNACSLPRKQWPHGKGIYSNRHQRISLYPYAWREFMVFWGMLWGPNITPPREAWMDL